MKSMFHFDGRFILRYKKIIQLYFHFFQTLIDKVESPLNLIKTCSAVYNLNEGQFLTILKLNLPRKGRFKNKTVRMRQFQEISKKHRYFLEKKSSHLPYIPNICQQSRLKTFCSKLICVDHFMAYNQYNKMIMHQREITNNLYLTPIKLDKTFREFEEDSCQDLVKSPMSSPSTIDSPLFRPKNSLNQDSDFEDDSGCISFQQTGCCNHGRTCNHSHSVMNMRHSNSFILQNYPELITRKPLRRIMSFLA